MLIHAIKSVPTSQNFHPSQGLHDMTHEYYNLSSVTGLKVEGKKYIFERYDTDFICIPYHSNTALKVANCTLDFC